jgi:hypothetical protein
MKKLLLLITLCAGAFAQTATTTSSQEVFGGVGVVVTGAPATKLQVNAGYTYNFTSTEAVSLGYDFTPVTTTNLNTFLGSYKRSFAPKPFGTQKLTPFVSVGVGATEFTGKDLLKFTSRFGAGVSLPLKYGKGVKLTIGAYGTKIDTLPVYFSSAVSLSKTF